MKKAIALVFVIFAIAIFSLLVLQINLTKSIASNNATQEYIWTQAKFKLEIYKSIILDEDNITCDARIALQDNADVFDVFFYAKCIDSGNGRQNAIVDLYVKFKDKSFHINLHERFTKKI